MDHPSQARHLEQGMNSPTRPGSIDSNFMYKLAQARARALRGRRVKNQSIANEKPMGAGVTKNRTRNIADAADTENYHMTPSPAR